MASYNYQKSKNSYSVYTDNGNFSYSVKKYGKYAECMAKYSYENGFKIKNWFKEEDNIIILYSYDINTDSYFEITIDKEDYELVKDYYWKATCDKDKKTYYAVSEKGTAGKDKEKIRMHRLLMDQTLDDYNNGLEVDHKDNNGLNNTRKNLRVVSASVNSRNKLNPNKRNTTGYSGVQFKDNSFLAYWTDDKSIKHSKSFNTNDYGYEKAKELAIEYRNKMVDKYYNRDK